MQHCVREEGRRLIGEAASEDFWGKGLLFMIKKIHGIYNSLCTTDKTLVVYKHSFEKQKLCISIFKKETILHN